VKNRERNRRKVKIPEIIFEDEAIVVVNKPAGVVVNKAQSTALGETIQEWHTARCNIPDSTSEADSEFVRKGGVVHRLDRDTSGVMVLAKTEQAYEQLKIQFLERSTAKKYVALVHGVFKEKEGVISAPIERNPNMNSKFRIGTDPAKMGITDWKVISEGDGFSYVELAPHTGRTHQLRVHMKHLGHPIVSDPIYGGKTYKLDLNICPRLFLHAKELSFTDPITDKRVMFEAQVPDELVNALKSLIHLS
jgi:23S rRNA pseudouridine1911/1915/1917 synthase